MKLIILGLFIFAFVIAIYELSSVLKDSNKYCESWAKGYTAGYCFEDNACIEPIVPVCPIPKIGFTSGIDGYNRGFYEGRKKKTEE